VPTHAQLLFIYVAQAARNNWNKGENENIEAKFWSSSYSSPSSYPREFNLVVLAEVP